MSDSTSTRCVESDMFGTPSLTCQILYSDVGIPDCYIIKLNEPKGNGLILVPLVESTKRTIRLLS